MADLSELFGPTVIPNPAQSSSGGFPLIRPTMLPAAQAAPIKATEFTRQRVMNEALEKDLSPEDGDKFFKFVGRRLFESGDIEGAMAVNQAAVQARQGALETQFRASELGLRSRELDIKESEAARKAAAPKNVELVKAIDPATGQPKFFKEEDAIGLQPVPSAPLVQVGVGDKIREKAEVEQEIARGRATPVIEEYLSTLNRLSEAVRRGDVTEAMRLQSEAEAQENVAARAVARLQEEGKLTDDDVKLALQSLPSVFTLRNALQRGGSFAREEQAFRRILGINSVGTNPATPEDIDNMSEAELDAFLNSNADN